MKVCVLGATGAIGTPISIFFKNHATVLDLNSKNCNLNNHEGIDDFSFSNCDIFINASGTFGGLKSYEKGGLELAKNYSRNLSDLIDQLNPQKIINISSASLSNINNHKKESPYNEYVKVKKDIEDLISKKAKGSLVINLRCTNIISKYEDFRRSGHSISSIYKNFLKSKKSIEIWSNEKDWREYLDADDLVSLLPNILKLDKNETLTIGSGRKTYMQEIIKYFADYLNFKGQIKFTQPNKNGPQLNTVSIPSKLINNTNFTVTDIEKSIYKCIQNWKTTEI